MFKKGDKVQFKKNWREIALGVYSNANTVDKIAKNKEKTLTFIKYVPSQKRKKRCECEEEENWFLYEEFLEFAKEENEL